MSEYNDLLHFLGNKIRELRKCKELSQEDFAFRCKLDRTYISGVERGKRNISVINLRVISEALGVRLSELFEGFPPNDSIGDSQYETSYIVKSDLSISCGFSVTSDDIAYPARIASDQLQKLPFALFHSIDLKALSGMTGALFSNHLAQKTGSIINPIEKGHPDIVPISGKNASEARLRNYPEGLEVKCTVGNVRQGSDLQTGDRRLPTLSGLTWQAHHREVGKLLGLVVDFAGSVIDNGHFPIITAAFYANSLKTDDWGKISGTTGRNTKVTGMKASGKNKMGRGWVIIIDEEEYRKKYGRILSFSVDL